MIRRPRAAAGGVRISETADAVVCRGMAQVLAALDSVIDDDAALGRIYAAHGGTGPSGPRLPASRRRVALRSVTGVAVAAAVAAVVLMAVELHGAGEDHTGGSAVNTAYVVKRVDRALSTAGPGAIAQLSVVTHGVGGTTTAQEWSYGDRWRSLTNSASGHPVYDEGMGSGSIYTIVSYPAGTWARHRESGGPAAALGPRGCAPVMAALPLFPSGLPAIDASAGLVPAAVARDLRAAISCGALAVAGRQRVDGIDAIELTSRPGSPISETVWVSPGTYLPVRVTVRSALGTQGPWQSADITWLSPTAQNLANLTVVVPAGFRQVPLGPLARHMSAGSAQKVGSAPSMEG
jgi:hypothetical protein